MTRRRRLSANLVVFVIGAILSIPIILLTASRLADVDAHLQTLALEREGLDRIVGLRALLAVSSAYRDSTRLSAAARERSAATVDTTVARLDDAEQRQSLIGEDWQRVHYAWRAYREIPAGTLSAQTLFDPLVAAIERTSDRTRLAPDPDPVIGPLADALSYRLPDGIERLQRLRLAIDTPVGSDSLDLRLTMAAESSVAASVLRFAFDDVEQAIRVDDTLAPTLETKQRIAKSATTALVDALGREARTSADQGALRALRPHVSSTLDSLYVLFDAVVPELDSHLQARVDQWRRRRLGSTIPGLISILGVFAIVFLAARALQARAELTRVRSEAERLEVEVARNRAEARFSAIFEEAVIGIVILSTDGSLRDTNPAFDSMLGHARGSLRGRPFVELLDPADAGLANSMLRALVAGERENCSLEQRYRRHDGRTTWAEVSLSVLRDDVAAPIVIALIHDVTERKRVDQQLIYAATHDSLTGLPNRSLLFARLDESLARLPRPKVGVLFIDLDHFKLVNDSLGHVVGDELLQAVAARLVAQSSKADMVARMGGDEFAVLFDGTLDPDDLTRRVDALLRSLGEPLTVDGRRIYTTASIGVVLAETRHRNAAELLRDADTAMYEAKSAGRGRAAYFDARMRVSTSHRMELASDLRGAVERGEFRLMYQPIVTLENEEIVAYEALLRWRHPSRGMLKPNRFLPIAVESGLIVPVGRWAIGEAVRNMATLHGVGHVVRMHVNLSVQEMMQPDLDVYLGELLETLKVPPEALVIEITENAIVESGPAAERALERLLRLGVRLCVDDFGVGYSSLRYLHQFPIDSLKVDGSFVRGVDGALANEPIVRMLVELARSLRLELIAEGIQTEAQRQALLRLGCRFGQGYLFGRPLWRPVGTARPIELAQEA